MAREIVLDTETTGIDHRRGHRLIEIGCVELEDLLPTGRTFHRYVNPEREIEPDAIRVHGITNEMVADKPVFEKISAELLIFVGDARLIAHNAAFDRGFVHMELERIQQPVWAESQWFDTLELARKKVPGQPNSLDALCKRFNISLAERDKHGALLDARLLAEVYLELSGGKERRLDLGQRSEDGLPELVVSETAYGLRPRPLAARISDLEAQRHEAFVAKYLKEKSLW